MLCEQFVREISGLMQQIFRASQNLRSSINDEDRNWKLKIRRSFSK